MTRDEEFKLIDEARAVAKQTGFRGHLVRWALRVLDRRYNPLNLIKLRDVLRDDI
jgi:hypothetical protein